MSSSYGSFRGGGGGGGGKTVLGKSAEDKAKVAAAALENLQLKKRLEEDRVLFEQKVREIQGYYETQMQVRK
jgi:hypothetical protein